MVRFRTVLKAASLVSTALVLAVFFAGAAHSTSAPAQTLTLGESFVLTLSSDNTLDDYAKLDTSELKSNFLVDDALQNRERVRLRLTPLQPGLVTVPALVSGGINVPAHTVDVLPNPLVSITWHAPNKSAMQGEWAVWQVRVTLTDAALPMQLVEPSAASQPNTQASIQPLQQQVGEKKISDFVQVVPLDTVGNLTVIAPVIQVTNRQGSRWLFSTAPQTVLVRAIPSYLPATLPVGTFSLSAQRPFWLRAQQLHQTQYIVEASNANLLPDLREQLTIERVENFTPKITANSTLKFHTDAQNNGLQQQRIFEHHFRPSHLGFGRYPQIDINFWDNQQQKLQHLTLPAQTYLVLPSWLYGVLYVVMGLLVLAGLVIAVLLLRIGYFNAKLTWDLQRATTPLAQWHAYQTWGSARGLGKPPTHQAWWVAYESKWGRNDKLAHWLQQNSALIYQSKDEKTK